MTTWDDVRAQWDDHPFHQLDFDEVTKEVNKYLKAVSQLEKGLPENKVVPLLKDKVDDMKNQVNLHSWRQQYHKRMLNKISSNMELIVMNPRSYH